MRVYFEFDAITDNCSNKCPFVDVGFKGETGPDCQVGSVTCKRCKFCYGHKDTGLDLLYLDNKLHMRPMSYVKCCWGSDRLTFWQKLQWWWHQLKVFFKSLKD